MDEYIKKFEIVVAQVAKLLEEQMLGYYAGGL